MSADMAISEETKTQALAKVVYPTFKEPEAASARGSFWIESYVLTLPLFHLPTVSGSLSEFR